MDYYKKVIKSYADFAGRARRKEYWMFQLVNFIIIMVLSLIASLFGKSGIAGIINLLAGVYVLFVFIPSIAVTVRRLHDTGKSGWWILIGLLPIIGGLVLFIFSVTDSQPGVNAYGPNPKEGMPMPPVMPATPVEPAAPTSTM